ncbi:hypothetical protein ABIA24_003772 [Sinorhizobium fredii]|uniref:Uncharacterized protein n=1 Tax=Sinorhizobium fredii (strain HH103) TaxID=1117943 RepID=G9A556_SINF1|nr:hypothetical protein SF83666_c37490 [Sinorhizobium fredii CCBAU 83666]AWI59529.1 hypothetical protein AB395_00003902 [Sinorhizobium fredii CCBAU 45436]AWM27208.1 hypothetical protein AOX55_00003984 [Sinorhizobium fredii CCBAU 25509]CCE98177.1 hypothetical protein SFHH103_03686 [Sinorhizobium fredii HH103]
MADHRRKYRAHGTAEDGLHLALLAPQNALQSETPVLIYAAST